MEPEVLLFSAQELLQDGWDAAEVNRRIEQVSGGRWRSVEDLQRAVADARNPDLTLGDAGRLFFQGLTQGFGDELIGLGHAVVPGGKGYGEAVEESRGRVEGLRRDHPVASFALEFAGGAAVPGGVGANVGKKVLARTGSRVLGAIAGGAAGGAVGGAISGIGEGEGVAGRAQGAAWGGAIGTATGGALGGVGGVAGRVARRLMPDGTSSDIASAHLNRTLDEAGLRSPDELLELTEELGPGAVPADVSPVVRRSARAVRNQAPALEREGIPSRGVEPGPVVKLEQRNAGRGERLAEGVRRMMGADGWSYDESLAAAQRNLEDVRAHHFRPIEDQMPVVNGERVRAALDNPRVQSAVKRAGVRPPDRGENGEVAFIELQDFLMDLRDELTAADNAGRPARIARAREAYRLVRQAMEDDIPGFAEAQEKYMHAIRRVDAHQQGRDYAYRRPRDVRTALRELPDDEARAAFRQGILDEWETALTMSEGGRSGGNLQTRLMYPGTSFEEHLSDLATSDDALQGMLQLGQREGRFARTWQTLQGNSTTSQQLADMDVPLVWGGNVKYEVVRRIMGWLAGTEADRRKAAELLGRVYMENPEVGREIINEIYRSGRSLAGIAGGAVGGQVGAEQTREVARPTDLLELVGTYEVEEPRGGGSLFR